MKLKFSQKTKRVLITTLSGIIIAFGGYWYGNSQAQINNEIKAKDNSIVKSANSNQIHGDLIQANNIDKSTGKTNYNAPINYHRIVTKKPENPSIVNNGNYNTGTVTGTLNQTITTERPPRELNDETKNDLNSIPKDYVVYILYGPSEESFNYAKEIHKYLYFKFYKIEKFEESNWMQPLDSNGTKREIESFNFLQDHEKKTITVLVQKRS